MKIDREAIKTVLSYIGKGGAVGFAIGSIAGAMSYKSKLSFDKHVKQLEAGEVDISSLRIDTVFLQAVMDLRAYRKIDLPRSKRVFETIVKCCNNIVHLYIQLNADNVVTPGVLQFRMSRYLRELREALDAMARMCRQQGQTQTEDMLLADYDRYSEAVYKCADNYIHNACLHNSYAKIAK